MANYNFQKDLPIAKKTELDIAKALENRYNAKILGIENTNKYDILASVAGIICTFEIKEDFTCEKTGNVGVEFSCRGKASGIEVSLADFYIYKLHTALHGIQYVIHKTVEIKEMIKRKSYFRIVNGGDIGSNSMNYLFKYNVFIKTGMLLPLDKIKE